MRKSPFLWKKPTHLCVFSFCMDTHEFLFFQCAVLIVFIHSGGQLSPAGPVPTTPPHSFGSCALMTHPYHFVHIVFGIARCSRFTLYFPSPSPRISHFSKETWVRHLKRNSILETTMGFGLPRWFLPRKESACNAGDVGSIHGSRRSPEDEMATDSSILAW